jgi:hypothetical protein
MNMPGFTAESSVYKAVLHYQRAASFDPAGSIQRPTIVASRFGGLLDPNCPAHPLDAWTSFALERWALSSRNVL